MSDPLFIFFTFGQILTVAGILLSISKYRSYSQQVSAIGTVVEMIHRHDEQEVYGPIVEFTSSSGEKQRFTHPWMSSPPSYQVGQQVKVRYSPSNTSKAAIDNGPFTAFLGPMVLTFGGILLMTVLSFLK